VTVYHYNGAEPTIMRLEYRTKWNLQQLGLSSLPKAAPVTSSGGGGGSDGSSNSSSSGSSGRSRSSSSSSSSSSGGSSKRRKLDGDLRSQQTLGTFLQFHPKLASTKPLLKKAGVETVADIEVLSDADLQGTGLTIVQVRVLRAALDDGKGGRGSRSDSDDDDECIDLT
jgi:hypothetical protein